MFAHTPARTDDDIGDDAAGRARKAVAEAAKARKALEAGQLARSNAEMGRRVKLASPSKKKAAGSPEPARKWSLWG